MDSRRNAGSVCKTERYSFSASFHFPCISSDFRIQFVRLGRIGCVRCQFLRGPRGEIGIGVDRDKEDIGIAGEFSVQSAKKL